MGVKWTLWRVHQEPSGFHPKKSVETTPDLLIVFHSKVGGQIRADCPDVERCSGNSTIKLKQPRALKVFHLWDSLQELGVAGDDLLKLTFDEFWSDHWSAQICFVTSSPHLGVRVNNSGGHFQLFTTGWANTSPIPDACLAVVYSDSGVAPQLLLQMRFTSTDRSGSGVMTGRRGRSTVSPCT